MSKLTVSPPRRLSKFSEVSTPLGWKKYSLPSSAAMNPNPRSDTIFFTVPLGIARSPPLEHRIERIGPVRERRMPAAREITRRPGERAYFSTLLRKAERSASGRGQGGGQNARFWPGRNVNEGNVLAGARYSAEIRWLFSAGLLVFVVTVSIGILNGFHFLTLPQQVLLTHVHAGTLGWITLGVLALCLWLFGEEDLPTGNPRAVPALSLFAAIAIPVYVLAFLSGNLLARAIFGIPVLIAIVGVLVWLVSRLGSVRLTVPRLAVVAAFTTLVVGSTIGVLIQLELAGKSTFLPEGAIGGHVTAQVVGYLVLIGMAISEWRLKNTPGLTWPGTVQIGLLFLGGILITIGTLLNIQALLGAFIPAELAAVIIYCVRLGPQLRRVNWLAPTSDRHFGLVVPYLVLNLGLLIWLITGVVTKAYARIELIPVWLIFAFDHTMFIGV